MVLTNGSVIHTGSRAKKSSSGYHLNGLFTGSEGTLGLITEITLKLHGIPEHEIAARCTFSSVDQCAEAAYMILLNDIPVKRMELVDAASVKQVNAYGDYHFPVEHSLFFEFAGSEQTAISQADAVRELMNELDCEHWEVAKTTREMNELWKARHEISLAFRHQKGMSFFGTDICVTISKLHKMLTIARELLEDSGLDGGILGHVGDGNFHTLILYNSQKEREVKAADKVNEELVHQAITFGGTCTGEHGVGLGKKRYQELEHGAALHIMKDIKKLLDPDNILNPGKIFE